jgi:hypothetical protein
MDDVARMQAVGSLRGAFRHFVSEGRLAAIIWSAWVAMPGKKTGGRAIFRCGAGLLRMSKNNSWFRVRTLPCLPLFAGQFQEQYQSRRRAARRVIMHLEILFWGVGT